MSGWYMKCVVCGGTAYHVWRGFSLCENHLEEVMTKEDKELHINGRRTNPNKKERVNAQ